MITGKTATAEKPEQYQLKDINTCHPKNNNSNDNNYKNMCENKQTIKAKLI